MEGDLTFKAHYNMHIYCAELNFLNLWTPLKGPTKYNGIHLHDRLKTYLPKSQVGGGGQFGNIYKAIGLFIINETPC